MAVSSVANSESFKVTTPSDREIRLTRLFDAPRNLVFEAMSKPEHITQWWGRLGDGYSVPVCEVDLRPGGAWRFVNRTPKGELVAFYGVYREIAPPERFQNKGRRTSDSAEIPSGWTFCGPQRVDIGISTST